MKSSRFYSLTRRRWTKFLRVDARSIFWLCSSMLRMGNSCDFTSESEVLIGSSALSSIDDWVLIGYILVGLRLSGELTKLTDFSF